MKKININLLMIVVGLIILVSPTIVSLQSVEYIQIQTSSPVVEGEVCDIDIRIKAGVGVSGTANLFIDEVFYYSIGGKAGSDGIMYVNTGWTAVGIGDHVLRVSYFEDDYPTQPFDASTVITVTGSSEPPPSEPFDFGLVAQIAGVGIAMVGGIRYVKEKKKT